MALEHPETTLWLHFHDAELRPNEAEQWERNPSLSSCEVVTTAEKDAYSGEDMASAMSQQGYERLPMEETRDGRYRLVFRTHDRLFRYVSVFEPMELHDRLDDEGRRIATQVNAQMGTVKVIGGSALHLRSMRGVAVAMLVDEEARALREKGRQDDTQPFLVRDVLACYTTNAPVTFCRMWSHDAATYRETDDMPPRIRELLGRLPVRHVGSHAYGQKSSVGIALWVDMTEGEWREAFG